MYSWLSISMGSMLKQPLGIHEKVLLYWTCQHLDECLLSTCMVLCIISNLYMVYNMQEVMLRYIYNMHIGYAQI